MGCGASKPPKPSAAEGLPLVVDKAAAEPEPKLFTALSSTSPWNTVKVDSVPTSVRSRKLSNPEPTDAALNPPAPPEEASSDASDAEGDGNFMMQQYTTSEDEDDSDEDDDDGDGDGGDGDDGNDEKKEGEGDGSFMMQQYSASSSADSSDEEQDTTTEEEEEEAPLTIGDRVDDALAPDYTGAHFGRLRTTDRPTLSPGWAASSHRWTLLHVCSQTFRR